jgi:hypothetical protein
MPLQKLEYFNRPQTFFRNKILKKFQLNIKIMGINVRIFILLILRAASSFSQDDFKLSLSNERNVSEVNKKPKIFW